MDVTPRRKFMISGLAFGGVTLTGGPLPSSTIDPSNFETDVIERYNAFNPVQMAPELFGRRQSGLLASHLRVVFDKSSSILDFEYYMQRDGTAAALRSDYVKNAILNSYGDDGQRGIGFSLSEFDTGFQNRIPEAILETEEDIEKMALIIEAMPPHYNRGGTGLANALNRLAIETPHLRLKARKYIVDISGDGPENLATDKKTGADEVKKASTHCHSKGVQCNGLAVKSRDFVALDFAPTIGDYYRDFVITENGFVIGATKWSDFRDAMEEKLVLEVAGEKPVQNHTRFYIA